MVCSGISLLLRLRRGDRREGEEQDERCDASHETSQVLSISVPAGLPPTERGHSGIPGNHCQSHLDNIVSVIFSVEDPPVACCGVACYPLSMNAREAAEALVKIVAELPDPYTDEDGIESVAERLRGMPDGRQALLRHVVNRMDDGLKDR